MPDRVKVYECDDIKVNGYAFDLAQAVAAVHLSVVPLRYGAGLKV